MVPPVQQVVQVGCVKGTLPVIQRWLWFGWGKSVLSCSVLPVRYPHEGVHIPSSELSWSY